MILTGLLEWFQDGPGIAITSLGVFGTGTFIVNAIALFKNIKNRAKFNFLVKELEDSVQLNKKILKSFEEKETVDQREKLAQLEQQEALKLILDGLTYVISAAGGIDDVTKVAFINDVTKSKELLVTMANDLKESSKEKVIEKTEELLNKTVETAEASLDKAQKQAQNILDKYSKR